MNDLIPLVTVRHTASVVVRVSPCAWRAQSVTSVCVIVTEQPWGLRALYDAHGNVGGFVAVETCVVRIHVCVVDVITLWNAWTGQIVGPLCGCAVHETFLGTCTCAVVTVKFVRGYGASQCDNATLVGSVSVRWQWEFIYIIISWTSSLTSMRLPIRKVSGSHTVGLTPIGLLVPKGIIRSCDISPFIIGPWTSGHTFPRPRITVSKQSFWTENCTKFGRVVPERIPGRWTSAFVYTTIIKIITPAESTLLRCKVAFSGSVIAESSLGTVSKASTGVIVDSVIGECLVRYIRIRCIGTVLDTGSREILPVQRMRTYKHTQHISVIRPFRRYFGT